MLRKPGDGFIYFIACEPMDAVKIGFTASNPMARLANLQTGCPAPLKLLAYVQGSIAEEQRLHSAFWTLRIQGEWFRLDGKLQDFIWYLDSEKAEADRTAFINALHDVLMQGLWYPHGNLSQDEYSETGDWEPFRDVLWNEFGPWNEGE